jgi:tRNA A37 threonylcarbamoyladenosine modification protein TsaB
MVKATGFQVSDFTGALVATGPGSFTGLRIGIAFVYGLFGLSKVPLLPFDSLANAAAAARTSLLLPATPEKGFVAFPGIESTSVLLSGMESALEASADRQDLQWVGIIDWPAAHQRLSENKIFAGLLKSIRSHEAMSLALNGVLEGIRSQQIALDGGIGMPSPRYLNLSSAEEKKLKQSTDGDRK